LRPQILRANLAFFAENWREFSYFGCEKYIALTIICI